MASLGQAPALAPEQRLAVLRHKQTHFDIKRKLLSGLAGSPVLKEAVGILLQEYGLEDSVIKGLESIEATVPLQAFHSIAAVRSDMHLLTLIQRVRLEVTDPETGSNVLHVLV